MTIEFAFVPERDFREASGALDVKPEDPQAEMVHVVHVLLPGVELPPFVDVLAAGQASHVTRGHQADDKGCIATGLTPRDLGGVIIRREVLVQHFSFRHF